MAGHKAFAMVIIRTSGSDTELVLGGWKALSLTGAQSAVRQIPKVKAAADTRDVSVSTCLAAIKRERDEKIRKQEAGSAGGDGTIRGKTLNM